MDNTSLAEQILQEHVALRAATQEMQAEIDRLRSESGPERGSDRLSGMLILFAHHLKRHFALEEQGGQMEIFSGIDPGAQRSFERLFIQHMQLEEKLEKLIEGAQRTEAGRACVTSAFAEGMHAFLKDLHQHECAENELVQEYFCHDIGTAD